MRVAPCNSIGVSVPSRLSQTVRAWTWRRTALAVAGIVVARAGDARRCSCGVWLSVPELPEVESVRRSLLPRLVGRAFLTASLRRRDVAIAPGDPPGGFPRNRRSALRPKAISAADMLAGATITEIERRGKQLALIARSENRALVVQLGMTGHLELAAERQDDKMRHVHARWEFAGGALHFRDPRRFGALRIFRSLDALREHWSTLGPDALSIQDEELAGALAGSDRPIKAALLDQCVLAGVGNIYADEALFLSHVHPRARTCRLRPAQVATLASMIRLVLNRAIEHGGSSIRDYTDGSGRRGSYQDRHGVYGRAGLPCLICHRKLSSGLVAQRTTVWCATCQPLTLKTNA